MIAPNKVGDADLASTSIPQRRKPPKLPYKRPLQHGLDEAVEEEPIVDALSTQKQGSVSKTSEDESNFEEASEEESSGIEAQLQPAPQRQRHTVRNKPFREVEERDGGEDEDVALTAGRQRPRRGRRGERQLVPFNTVDNVGRTVGQSGDLVRNITGRNADRSGRVVARQSERNEPTKKEKDEQLRLHLELNLDLEVELKAKITGDLTLTLLQ